MWARTLAFLVQPVWSQNVMQHWGGGAVFATSFRRPILSVLQEFFHQMIEVEAAPGIPQASAVDEVFCIMVLLPLCKILLRSELRKSISCSDASLSGGGSAEASTFKPVASQDKAWLREEAVARLAEESMWQDAPNSCATCGSAFQDMEERVPCPSGCSGTCCSFQCGLAHFKPGVCEVFTTFLPHFAEIFSGPRAPLTQAVAEQGVAVRPPMDRLIEPFATFGAPSGDDHIAKYMDDPHTAWEHSGTCCKLMSRRRGKPIVLASGSVIKGPQAVRNGEYPLGFPDIKSWHMRERLRVSNHMAQFSL